MPAFRGGQPVPHEIVRPLHFALHVGLRDGAGGTPQLLTGDRIGAACALLRVQSRLRRNLREHSCAGNGLVATAVMQLEQAPHRACQC